MSEAVLKSLGAPQPWRVADAGVILDANGRPVAYLDSRLAFPPRLENQAESWRPIANRLAAAPEMAAALAELIDYTAEMLSSPIFCAVQWGPDSGPNGEVMQRARAALGKAHAAGSTPGGDPGTKPAPPGMQKIHKGGWRFGDDQEPVR